MRYDIVLEAMKRSAWEDYKRDGRHRVVTRIDGRYTIYEIKLLGAPLDMGRKVWSTTEAATGDRVGG